MPAYVNQPVAGAAAFLLGDSHTLGAFGSELRSRLQAAGASSDTRAVVGWHISEATASLTQTPIPVGAVLVLVALGHNDWGGPPTAVERAADRLAALIEQQAPTARLVWVGPPKTRKSDARKATEGIAAALARRPRWTFLDSRPITSSLPTGADGMHFGTVAGAAWASAICTALALGDAAQKAKNSDAGKWVVGVLGGGLLIGGLLLAARRRR